MWRNPNDVLQLTYGVTRERASMAETTFTFRVDEELKAAFSDAAKAHDQTGAQLLRRFMREYVKTQQDEYDAWFRKQVQVGLDSANAGHLIPAEEVEAKFTKRRAETRRKLRRSAA
jgi:predicted transcriptional regulator